MVIEKETAMQTFIFNRDPELGSEPASMFHGDDGLIYVTTDNLEAGVEPIGIVSYPCGCDATVSCPECV